MLRESETFIKLLVNNEDWLMGRILHYAKSYNYTKYTSTLQKAWRMSIRGISESLILLVKSSGIEPPELHPDECYQDDLVARFGRIEVVALRLQCSWD